MMPAAENRPVIVVEDDPSMSQALERILRLGGLSAITYTSAEALLSGGAVASAGCLVLDVQLPKVGGFELHERILRMGVLVPVIFITAFDDPAARTRAARAGAAAFLTKPFSGKVLLEVIGKAMRRTHATLQAGGDRT